MSSSMSGGTCGFDEATVCLRRGMEVSAEIDIGAQASVTLPKMGFAEPT